MVSQADRDDTCPRFRWNFGWGTATGVLYELGAAFVDTGTVIPAFLGNLTTSGVAVGAAEALRRFGWLAPQLPTAHYAQGRRYRKAIYLFAGFGRALCIAALALVLLLVGQLLTYQLLLVFFATWTAYSFISGVAGVPYNDIVGRVIPSERRSTFLSVRFLGGGILAVGAGLVIRKVLAVNGSRPFPINYGVIFALGAISLTFSSLAFSRIREPPAPVEEERQAFNAFVRAGWQTLMTDRRFRLFYLYQLLAGVTAMALPFYVVQARRISGLPEATVGTLLAAQQAGTVVSNPVWGAWGDRRGKLSLLRGLSWIGAISPVVTLGIPLLTLPGPTDAFWLTFAYGVVFFAIGSLLSGELVGHIGYLMEISPDDLRADYSGYMSTFVAPIRILPLFAGVVAELFSVRLIFWLALLSVAGRLLILHRLETTEE